MNYLEYLELQETFEKEGQALSWNIARVICGSIYLDQSSLIAAAYVLYKANDEYVSLDTIDTFCDSINADEDRRAFLESCVGDSWQMVAGQRFRYSEAALKSLILFYEDRDYRHGDEGKTPASISRLAYELFELNDGDEIADFGVGSASFSIECFLRNQTLQFYGIEINASAKEIAAIRMDVLGCRIRLEHGNILDMDTEAHKFDHIFSNYPFGLRIREIGFDRNRLIQNLARQSLGFTKSVSSDWFFNAAIVDCLRKGGKGVAVMTNGSTWNTLDKSARRYFIENGYLQAVIALPERLFESTSIPTTMVVFSEHNEQTMLVDATGLYEKGRRYNSFSEANIDQIVYATKHETANSKLISRAELADNDYVINPTRYLTDEIIIENGVPFSSIIKSITRGAPLKASDLDALVSEDPTDCQYLMLANIQRGQIEENLPYLKEIQDSQKKYCLKNHDLILSKNGAPFKIAVAEVPEGKTILANGNLYIVEIDETKADPYFVKAFLESEKGTALLKSITVGATIPNIGVEALKKILIPQIPLVEQHEIASRYLAKLDEIALFQRKLQKAYEELSHIYDTKE